MITPSVPTVATEALPDIHTPPGTLLVNVVVEPAHTVDTPDVTPGFTLTDTGNVLLQPVPNVYVISAVPAVTPVTTPVAGFTFPMVMFELLQVPPDGELDRLVVRPIQVLGIPAMGDGSASTVITFTVLHPIPIV